jgi:hypothetical protein
MTAIGRYRETEQRLWLPRSDAIDGFLAEPFFGSSFGNINYDLIYTFTNYWRDTLLPVTPHVRVGPNLEETISISIEREPRILTSNRNIFVPPSELEKIVRMIRINRVLLLDHWCCKYDTFGFLDMVRKID